VPDINGNDYSVREIIERVKKVSQKDLTVEETPARVGDPVTLIGSSRKAHDILGWEPKFFDIETIIQTAWDRHRKE